MNDGALRAEIVNRLQELVISDEDGQDLLLFDRLCRIAREGAGTAHIWTRQTLLSQLRGTVRLRVIPNYRADVDRLQSFSLAGMADVSEEIAGYRVERPALEEKIKGHLAEHRLVNISGLPGCGKSAMLKRVASEAATNGPILFLKADRLEGTSWQTFAVALGVRHSVIADLLAEVGSAGTPVLFIDGIDRIKPDQKGIITDILRAIEANESLTNWKVLASSRDQGLEAYRTWFPVTFYSGTGIGDIPIEPFSDDEAEALAKEQPHLRGLLFGSGGHTRNRAQALLCRCAGAKFSEWGYCSSDRGQSDRRMVGSRWTRCIRGSSTSAPACITGSCQERGSQPRQKHCHARHGKANRHTDNCFERRLYYT